MQANNKCIPQSMFTSDKHYLGKPADFNDKIVSRRIRLIRQFPGFLNPDCELLDIGCGNGASLFALAGDMKHCHGIDINDEHFETFNIYRNAHNINNCSMELQDIEQEIPKRQFDRIISFEVIEHLRDENSIRHYHQALKDDGILAISVPNRWWIFETHGARLPILPWNRVPFFSWLPTRLHDKYANARIYSKKRITSLLQKHGFQIRKINYITAPMDVLPNGRFKNFIVKHFFRNDTTPYPFKSTSILIIATKFINGGTYSPKLCDTVE